VSCFVPPQVAKQQAGGSDATAGGARKAADVDPPEPSKPPPDGPDGYIVDPPMVVRTSCAYHRMSPTHHQRFLVVYRDEIG
jgi:hypothetical protein